MTRMLANWLAVLSWLGIIYYFSDQPNLKSALAPTWDYLLRKTAHFLEYFVLGYLVYRATRGHNLAVMPSLIASVGFAAVYAASDEWHQGWVAGRTASPLDALIDTSGALTAGLLLFKRDYILK